MMNSSPRVEVSESAERASVAPFQVRGRFFTAIVLQMARAPDATFFDAVDTMLAQTPHFYANAPFVLDLDRAEDIGPSFDFIGLARELRNRKVTLIGVQNGTIEQNKAALHAGLITLPSGTDVLPDSRKQNAAPKDVIMIGEPLSFQYATGRPAIAQASDGLLANLEAARRFRPRWFVLGPERYAGLDELYQTHTASGAGLELKLKTVLADGTQIYEVLNENKE